MAATPPAAQKLIHASPTKDFFVNMITKDISLEDCIFDLLDNSIDGAKRHLAAEPAIYLPYAIDIDLSADRFRMKDNCGGIRLSDAIEYAFHFGRRPDAPLDVKGGIGLYGIGMKRAIFKIGRSTRIRSEADDACFTVSVNVDEWLKMEGWDFEYADDARTGTRGTDIVVEKLNRGIREAFVDPVFLSNLVKGISRDYSFFIDKGLRVNVAGTLVPSVKYHLREATELKPAVETLEEDGVRIRLIAGFADSPPDETPDESRPPRVDRFGWFVICNDRVVVSADKTDKTIWGDDGYKLWHPQYNGFAGFAFFESDDQRKLPWTTTKRDLDNSNPMYRRVVARMKSLTDDFIAYTNRRKADLEDAKKAEAPANTLDVYTMRAKQNLVLPKLSASPGPRWVSVVYKRPLKEVEEVKERLGDISMSASEAGLRTFQYYRKLELGR
jgi:hypothetical protein